MGFSLLETMRLDGGRMVRLEPHLTRAAAGAATLGFAWDEAGARAAVDAAATAHPDGVWRTRLLLTPEGHATAECTPLVHDETRVWRVALAANPVASHDPSLRVKTTRRELYEH